MPGNDNSCDADEAAHTYGEDDHVAHAFAAETGGGGGGYEQADGKDKANCTHCRYHRCGSEYQEQHMRESWILPNADGVLFINEGGGQQAMADKQTDASHRCAANDNR